MPVRSKCHPAAEDSEETAPKLPRSWQDQSKEEKEERRGTGGASLLRLRAQPELQSGSGRESVLILMNEVCELEQ